LTLTTLASMKWRAIDVDVQHCTGSRLRCHWTTWLPNVFANCYTHQRTINSKQ